ncbi:MAG: GNAT family N-acetyltransferase [Thermoanaerobaculia bacterium]|nr:GNAT family N-acetyltransferase [Thermoanaerobaculia bacterium]
MAVDVLSRSELRPVATGDRDLLAEIYFSTRRDEIAPLSWSSEEKERFLRQQFEAQFEHYRRSFGGIHSIVEVAGEPAGRLWVEERDDEIRVIDIAILPTFRGQGLGTELLRDVQRQAASRGVPVRIHVEKQNLAMELYRRLGFRTIEDKGVYDLLEWRGD